MPLIENPAAVGVATEQAQDPHKAGTSAFGERKEHGRDMTADLQLSLFNAAASVRQHEHQE